MTFRELDRPDIDTPRIAAEIAKVLKAGNPNSGTDILRLDQSPESLKMAVANSITDTQDSVERQWFGRASALVIQHNQFRAMETTLDSVEGLLRGYMCELGQIRSEIAPLQSASSSLSQEKAMLDSEAASLRDVLSVLIIDPSIIPSICDAACESERFLEAFKKVSSQIRAHEGLSVPTSSAVTESRAELSKLRQKAMSRLRVFFVSKFNSLAQPGVDFMSLQSSSLLPLKHSLLPAIRESEPVLLEELASMYNDLVSRLLVYQFQSYFSACIDPFLAKLSLAGKCVPTDCRLKLTEGICQRAGEECVVPPKATLEDFFLCISKLVADTASEEEYFLREFFPSIILSQIFSPSLAIVSSKLTTLLDNCPDDVVGLVLVLLVLDFFGGREKPDSLLRGFFQSIQGRVKTRLVTAMTRLCASGGNCSLVETRRVSDLVACVFVVAGKFSDAKNSDQATKGIEGFCQGWLDKASTDPVGILNHLEAVTSTVAKKGVVFPKISEILHQRVFLYADEELFRRSGFPGRTAVWFRSNWKAEVSSVEKLIIKTFPSLSLARDVFKQFLDLVVAAGAGAVAPATIMAELRGMDNLFK